MFVCSQCGFCCRATNIKNTATYLNFTDDDITRIAAFLDLTEEEFLIKYNFIGNSINTTKQDCPFLDGNKCSIHETKPLHCVNSNCKDRRFQRLHNKGD